MLFLLIEIRNSSIRDSFSRNKTRIRGPSKLVASLIVTVKKDPPKKPFSFYCAMIHYPRQMVGCLQLIHQVVAIPTTLLPQPSPAILLGGFLPQTSGFTLGFEEAEDVVLTNCTKIATCQHFQSQCAS